MFGFAIEIPIGNVFESFHDTNLLDYIVEIHKFAVIIAAILAVIFMMIGGFLWLSSAGNSQSVSTGQNFIKGAIIGLILTLFSWYILAGIDTRLVNLSIKQPEVIQPTEFSTWVCCQREENGVPVEAFSALFSCSAGYKKIADSSCSDASKGTDTPICHSLANQGQERCEASLCGWYYRPKSGGKDDQIPAKSFCKNPACMPLTKEQCLAGGAPECLWEDGTVGIGFCY